ncbi:MAG: rhodanese-like domain-containing protein [Chlamydiae bacterium]|nr:rhodanese-like domain-containing protein [Chlamydiota bacterium]
MDQLEVTYETMKQWDLSKTHYTLIDIREEEERKQEHIGGDWIPLSELLSRLNEIPSGSIILYCRSGGRSLMATKKLRDVLSRDDIYSLHGGILGYPK